MGPSFTSNSKSRRVNEPGEGFRCIKNTRKRISPRGFIRNQGYFERKRGPVWVCFIMLKVNTLRH